MAVAIVTGSGLKAADYGVQTQAASMPGYPAPGGPATVTLAAPGAEPRTKLRYKVAAGLKETISITTTIGLTMSMEGMAMPTMDLPMMKLTADMAVTAVAPNGDITYDVAFTGMTAEAAPGMDPSLAAMMQGAADGITALKGSATISDRGVSRSTTINVDKITDPNLKQTLSAVANSLEGMSMPMPEEAVGVGAKWEVRQASKAAGAQTFQRIECELTSVDAQGATIRVKLEQTAPPQGISNPALPAGSVVNIEKLAGTGTGTIAMRFNSLVPTSEMSSSTAMAMAMDMGGQTQRVAVDTKVKVSIAPKKN
jgi:hypothetical protein